MRLDYSDKMKAVRESAERVKPVQKNRPRREPIGTFAVVGLLLLALGYGAGVLTGWFLFKGKVDAKALAAAQAAAQQKAQAAAVAQPAPAAQPGQAVPPGQPGQPAPDVPLTFYKTLPSGGKGAMGSGINTKLPEVQSKAAAPAPAANAAPAAEPASAKPAAAAAAAKAPEAKPVDMAGDKAADTAADKPAAEKQGGEARYLVQVASYKDRKEADAVRAKLVAKGVAAYLVESKLPDKGVWYRIRVGRHLSRQEAQQVAGKVGSGATVVAE
ncbi:SPOR domain-containing protein [Geomonas paludis]|uniref:SPOR domain-containing protein n=1 Tax=Geomonas paludis TaxID=2740185 RepID=A0A6V8MV19_9BACT|nr:SPOR domain-containing protein [Geomonas paludis]UPU38068.1 SPOR domain-containing protein [Geomonas paludis]GFO63403.1 SPOR domain-containing protein [Geomonas paludis]